MTRAESITFFGPDGCGKSTVAERLADLLSVRGEVVKMLGGSSFEQWLTAAMAREFVGHSKRFDTKAVTAAEKTRLYEDIAIVCYGQSQKLVEKGANVIIDSDPYLKRIVWARLSNGGEENPDYELAFEQRMLDHLGQNCFPTWAVGINVSATETLQDANHFARIDGREVVSGYDPSSIEEAMLLGRVSTDVWREVVRANRYKRAANVRTLEMSNPDCPAHLIGEKTLELAMCVQETIYEF